MHARARNRWSRAPAEPATPGWGDCPVALPLHPAQIVVLDRQGPDALAGSRKDGVAHRRRDRRRPGLADAAPFAAAREGEVGLDPRHLGLAQHPVIVEVALNDAALLD